MLSEDEENLQPNEVEIIESKLIALEKALQTHGLLNHSATLSIRQVIELRANETENSLGDKSADYFEFLDNQTRLIECLGRLAALKTLSPLHTDRPLPSSETLKSNAHTNFKAEVLKFHSALELIALKLLFVPYSRTLGKDLKLLAQTATCVHNFYVNPRKTENLTNLTAATQLVYRKTGIIWRRIKHAATAVIGVGCIVIGVLGVLPSIGLSIGLIIAGTLIGTAICADLHKKNNPEKMMNSDQLYKNLRNMLKKANKYIYFANRPLPPQHNQHLTRRVRGI